eukprot:9413921-Pyramimonas_sp.AAC.1
MNQSHEGQEHLPSERTNRISGGSICRRNEAIARGEGASSPTRKSSRAFSQQVAVAVKEVVFTGSWS